MVFFEQGVSPIHLILVDDHTLVRAGIRTLLEEIPQVRVVAEAANSPEAIELAEAHRPDIALIATERRDHESLETVAQLRILVPAMRILILSPHASEEFILQALKIGVSGYLLRRSAPSELKAALHEVMRGRLYLSPIIPKRIIDFCLMRMHDPKRSGNELTPRQRQILQLIAESRNTKEIAVDLNVSVKTVEFHRARLMKRLQIYDVAGLVRYALRTGLVPIE